MSKKKTNNKKANTKPVANQATLIEEGTSIADTLQEDSEVVIETEETAEIADASSNTDEYIEMEPAELLEGIIHVVDIQTENIEDVVASEVIQQTSELQEENSHDGNNVAIEDLEVETKKSTKKQSTSKKNTGAERVKLVGSSYHYYRNFLKELLRSKEIQSGKFIKDPTGWKGYISIPADVKEQALECLNQYQTENPDIKPLWWEVSLN